MKIGDRVYLITDQSQAGAGVPAGYPCSLNIGLARKQKPQTQMLMTEIAFSCDMSHKRFNESNGTGLKGKTRTL